MDFKINKSPTGWEASFIIGGSRMVFKGVDKKSLLTDIKKQLDTCDLANELADNCRQDGGTICDAQDVYTEAIDKVIGLYEFVQDFGGERV